MVREWDDETDQIILNRVIKDGKVYFNQLLIEINDAGIPVTQRKLSNHLKRFESEHILIRNDFSPGKKRFCSLHPDTVIKLALDILERVGTKFKGNKKKHHQTTVQEKNKNAIRLLLTVAAAGTIKKHPIISDEVSPGHYFPYDPETGLVQVFQRGVSEQDAINVNDNIKFFRYRKFGGHLSLSDIRESIKKLRQHEIILPTSESAGETRFDFSQEHERLRNFIFDCNIILEDLLERLDIKCINLNKRVTLEESNWYSSIFGIEEKERYMRDLGKKRKEYHEIINDSKKWQDNSYVPDSKYYREEIKEINLKIKDKTNKLEKNYVEVKKRYPVIYDLIIEMIRPSFLP